MCLSSMEMTEQYAGNKPISNTQACITSFFTRGYQILFLLEGRFPMFLYFL